MVTSRTKPQGVAPSTARATATPSPKVPSREVVAKAAETKPVKPSPKVMPTPPLVTPLTKPIKPKKVKPVRDSFTMPKGEYAALSDLKLRAIKLAHPAKKSELIRAGVAVLSSLSDADFLATVKALPAIKTGRPSKADTA